MTTDLATTATAAAVSPDVRDIIIAALSFAVIHFSVWVCERLYKYFKRKHDNTAAADILRLEDDLKAFDNLLQSNDASPAEKFLIRRERDNTAKQIEDLKHGKK